MLRHATRQVLNRVKHKHRDSAFVVVSCPDDAFPSGACFSQIDVELGLKDECWPQGMRFRRANGGNVLTVNGKRLTNAEDGLCLI